MEKASEGFNIREYFHEQKRNEGNGEWCEIREKNIEKGYAINNNQPNA